MDFRNGTPENDIWLLEGYENEYGNYQTWHWQSSTDEAQDLEGLLVHERVNVGGYVPPVFTITAIQQDSWLIGAQVLGGEPLGIIDIHTYPKGGPDITKGPGMYTNIQEMLYRSVDEDGPVPDTVFAVQRIRRTVADWGQGLWSFHTSVEGPGGRSTFEWIQNY